MWLSHTPRLNRVSSNQTKDGRIEYSFQDGCIEEQESKQKHFIFLVIGIGQLS